MLVISIDTYHIKNENRDILRYLLNTLKITTYPICINTNRVFYEK